MKYVYSTRSQSALFDAPFWLRLRQSQKKCSTAWQAASALFFRLPRLAQKRAVKNAHIETALSIIAFSLLLSSFLNAEEEVLFKRVACLDVGFKSHWHSLFANIEPGLGLAFKKTTLRFEYKDSITKPDPRTPPVSAGPVYTNCIVEFLVDRDGTILDGTTRVMTDFQFYEKTESGKRLAHEGLRIHFVGAVAQKEDPGSLKIKEVRGFSLCRTRSDCVENVIPKPINRSGEPGWIMLGTDTE